MAPILSSLTLSALLPLIAYYVALDTKGWEEPITVVILGMITIGLINGRRLQSWINYVSSQVEGPRWSIGAGDREVLARHTLTALLDLPRPLPPLGGFRISSQEGLMIASIIERERPRRVVELGSGCSSVIIARQLQRNGGGHLISIDHDERYFESTRAMLRDYGVSDTVELRHAPITHNPSGRQWYDEAALNDIEDIDLLLIDGPPGSTCRMAREGALPFFSPRLRSGGIVIVDDANRRDEAAMIEQLHVQLGMRLELLSHAEKGVAVLRVP